MIWRIILYLYAELFGCISSTLPGPQILLPRPVGEQVNISVLDLGNYSTTTIDIPVADNTLVLKVQ